MPTPDGVGEDRKQLNLYISGRKLRDLDTVTKSDPKCILLEWRDEDETWVKVGETEQLEDNLNPNFATCLTVNYRFEALQQLKFVFIDKDIGEAEETIGEIETTMGALMGARK